MNISKISIIGLGAVGAIYAWRLSEYLGYDNVHVVVDKNRKDRYDRNGIFLNDAQVFFNLVTPQETYGYADVVIISTKNNQFQEAIEAISSHVGPSTMILSLLNGLDSEEILGQRFGEAHVLYGFTTALDSTRMDNHINFSTEGIIIFGEHDNIISKRILALQQLFSDAKISCKIPDDIHREMWAKFMVNVSINSISAITRATYGHCATIESIRNMIIETQREVIALANASGIKGLDETYIDHYQKVFAALEPTGKTSMLQDIETTRVSENPWFCQKASQIGKNLGVPTPLCDMLGTILEGIDAIHQQTDL